jgi:hypothetical protein
VEGVCQEQVAPEPATGPSLEPDHPDIHYEGKHQKDESSARHAGDRAPGDEPRKGTPDQLEYREGQQEGNEQRTQSLELGMSVGMLLVWRLGSHPDYKDCKEIVRRIDRRLEGIAEDRQ